MKQCCCADLDFTVSLLRLLLGLDVLLAQGVCLVLQGSQPVLQVTNLIIDACQLLIQPASIQDLNQVHAKKHHNISPC